MITPPSETGRPSFLDYSPTALRFGTSGLRGLVREMTDLEVYINTCGFLDYLRQNGALGADGTVALARDLRQRDPASGLSSSPRIAAAVTRAILDRGLSTVNCGCIPTPALALYAQSRDAATDKQPIPGIMVTGSHIPADRNGIKFYKPDGEVLKSDEEGIFAAVAAVRDAEYRKTARQSAFDADGMLKAAPPLGAVNPEAEALYLARYSGLFPGQRPLDGKRIVVWQHSAVGRDLLVSILESLGATVIPVGRSKVFIPVDTEDVGEADERHFHALASRHASDAIISTDGDGDRPLVVDEKGRFHRGDVVGIVTAGFLGAAFAAVPINSSDALDRWAESDGRALTIVKTRIGSPYVVAAMRQAVASRVDGVVAWEANGGFLTATDFIVNGHTLAALPTRDAVLPILAALLSAARRKVPLSHLFAELPQRATFSGLLDDFPRPASAAVIKRFSPTEATMTDLIFGHGEIAVRRATGEETLKAADPAARALGTLRQTIQDDLSVIGPPGSIVRLNYIDGVRIWFDNDDIIHIRPSGNAPQLRIYALSDVEKRARDMVSRAIAQATVWTRYSRT